MFSFLRDSKLSYAVFNFFHKKKLAHNIPLFKKYGIKKKYFSPISSSDFKELETQYIRQENPEGLANTTFYQHQTHENQYGLSQYYKNGYSIVRGFITSEQADTINAEIDRLQASGELQFRYGNKLMFAIHKSETIKSIGLDKELMQLLDVLVDGKSKLFQSINFINGSQ